jgi:hypothetical protein
MISMLLGVLCLVVIALLVVAFVYSVLWWDD